MATQLSSINAVIRAVVQSEVEDAQDDAVLLSYVHDVLKDHEECDESSVPENVVEQQEHVDDEEDRHSFYGCDIPAFTDDTFKVHFRMARSTVEVLHKLIGKDLREKASRTVPDKKKILLTLWVCGCREPFSSIADRFGMNKGTAYKFVMYILKIVRLHKNEVIKWPSLTKCQVIAAHFRRTCGFPCVAGVADACYVKAKAAKTDKARFRNWQGEISVVLQGICDHSLSLIDVYAQSAGSEHLAHVFRDSPIGSKLLNSGTALPAEFHVLAGASYPCVPNILTPFCSTNITPQQQKYNVAHGNVVLTIEATFGILKAMFPRLNYLDMVRVDNAPTVIEAVCCLYNLVIEHEGLGEVETEYEVPSTCCAVQCERSQAESLESGIQKRLEVMRQVYSEHR